MGRLIILAGGSGAGKSFVLKNIKLISERVKKETGKPEEYSVIKKFSTRAMRANETEENSDLYFNASPEDLQKCGDFKYLYGNHVYGVNCQDIDTVLNRGDNPVVIVRDVSIITKLKNKYSGVIDIYCTSAYSGEDLIKRLQQNGCTDAEISERMENVNQDKNQLYYSSNNFYEIVRNWYDETFLEQIVAILKSAPNLSQKTICVVGTKKLVSGVVDFALPKFGSYDIKTVFIDEIDLDDEVALNKIKEARLVIVDISITGDSSSKFEWLVDIKELKNMRDILLIQSAESSIPFDIYDHKIYKCDKKDGSFYNTISTQVERILEQ